MKDKTKLVCKGILLYTTIIICIVSAMGLDSIYDEGYLFIALLLCTGLVYLCHKVISGEEIEILTLNKYLERKRNKDK